MIADVPHGRDTSTEERATAADFSTTAAALGTMRIKLAHLVDALASLQHALNDPRSDPRSPRRVAHSIPVVKPETGEQFGEWT